MLWDKDGYLKNQRSSVRQPTIALFFGSSWLNIFTMHGLQLEYEYYLYKCIRLSYDIVCSVNIYSPFRVPASLITDHRLQSNTIKNMVSWSVLCRINLNECEHVLLATPRPTWKITVWYESWMDVIQWFAKVNLDSSPELRM